MPYLNKVYLLGHVGRDAEERFTSAGKKILSFSLATSNGKDKPTDWHAITVFDPPNWQTISKGDLVFVEGRISYESWTGKDGHKRYKTNIIGRAYNLNPTAPTKDPDDIPF